MDSFLQYVMSQSMIMVASAKLSSVYFLKLLLPVAKNILLICPMCLQGRLTAVMNLMKKRKNYTVLHFLQNFKTVQHELL